MLEPFLDKHTYKNFIKYSFNKIFGDQGKHSLNREINFEKGFFLKNYGLLFFFTDVCKCMCVNYSTNCTCFMAREIIGKMWCKIYFPK